MLPVKKILCPTDFSEHSYKALDVAVEWAQKFDSEILLVHVIHPMPAATGLHGGGGIDLLEYQKELEKVSAGELERIMKKRIPEKVRVRPLIINGSEADEIVKAADDQDVDLIVIATHGRTGLERLFMGSVAEKVLRHTRHPVLMIRSK